MADCYNFASKAKHRITIQKPTESTDIYGGRTVTWADVGTFWAEINPISSREVYVQQTTQSRTTHKMIIRYQAALKDIKVISDYRVSFDGRLFGFNGLRNLAQDLKAEGKDYQELAVEENAPDITG